MMTATNQRTDFVALNRRLAITTSNGGGYRVTRTDRADRSHPSTNVTTVREPAHVLVLRPQ